MVQPGAETVAVIVNTLQLLPVEPLTVVIRDATHASLPVMTIQCVSNPLSFFMFPILAHPMRAPSQGGEFLTPNHADKQEAIMFQVLDHAAVVYTGELSQTTQYVIDHYGKKLDEAIRSGIKIIYADPIQSEIREGVPGRVVPDFWKPFEDWTLD